jgi:hypothetical protein
VPDASQVPARCKPGDLWTLGNHRLLCGDSTKAEDVTRLLDGAVPFIMVTDPPYGVEYDPTWRDDQTALPGRTKTRMTGKVENDDRIDWSDTYKLFPGHVAYVWHAGRFAADLVLNLRGGVSRCGRSLSGGSRTSLVIGSRPLSLAARAMLVCGACQRLGQVVRRQDAKHSVDIANMHAAVRGPTKTASDQPQHAKARRVHGPPDPQPRRQDRRRVRPLPRLRHHAHRRRAAWPPLLRPRNQPGLLRRDPGPLGKAVRRKSSPRRCPTPY